MRSQGSNTEESYSSGNKGCIVTMRGIPVTSIEDSNGVFVLSWQSSKITDEPDFIVDLKRHKLPSCQTYSRDTTLSSGLDDIAAVKGASCSIDRVDWLGNWGSRDTQSPAQSIATLEAHRTSIRAVVDLIMTTSQSLQYEGQVRVK